MKSICINQSKKRMPRQTIEKCVSYCGRKLKSEIPKNVRFVVIVYVDRQHIQKLNKDFRKKNSATDILSFRSDEEGSLGELIVCPEILERQATLNDWTQKREAVYMVIHGLLHLLGYDHEKEQEAKKMFDLQEALFSETMKTL